jgi:hypothetical protein
LRLKVIRILLRKILYKVIVFKGPTKDTVCDFWRMIVEYELKAVVMLNHINENEKV